jgi:glyoxylase-like metal-dependent hydrolase (beta-lactamase superfamily II)
MSTTHRRLATVFAAIVTVSGLAGLASTGCAATSHPTVAAPLGTPSSSASLDRVVDAPGPVTVETVIGAEWEVPRSGLINLDNPKAKAAHLEDGPEPITIMFHAIRHPGHGLLLVDSGVEHAFVADPDHALLHGMIGSFAHLDKLKVHVDTGTWLAQQGAPVEGVLLTHFHLDHVLGLRDVPASVPVFVGAGDPHERSFMNVLESGIYDAALEGKGPLREVSFTPDRDADFEGVADVFGDGSFWAIWVPGHTPGSVAYLARTPTGPVLLTGDACHTAWGWENGVEPGTFSEDVAKGAASLARLRSFAARHPSIDVRLGHQVLHVSPPAAAASRL